MNFQYFSLVLINILFLSHSVNAQLNADFSANNTSGCDQIVVQFTNLSMPGTGLSYQWQFGNGNTSVQKDPAASYITPGSYDVTLIIFDGNNYDTLVKYDYITVFENPQADFSITSAVRGCVPLLVSFNNLSQQGDAAITQWQWDFSDGSISYAQNPNHVFSSPNTYNIFLKVTDLNGCTDTITKLNSVEVLPKPFAAFSANKINSCVLPTNITFTNSSSGTTNLTYMWDFGDGDTSSNSDPTHTYTNYGSYMVRLVATDTNGCIDTLSIANFIRIIDVKADFTLKDTVCPDEEIQVYLTNNSVGAASYLWNFGDGDTSHNILPSHVYQTAGTYFVSLQVTGMDPTCVFSHTDTIRVDSVVAAFSLNPTYSCSVPFTVNFQDSSIGAVSWLWRFGDMTSSNMKDPSHNYFQEGVFSVLLKVTSSNGCTDSFLMDSAVTIILPHALIDADTVHGCAPLKVDFTDMSTSNENIISWLWDFDDATTSTLRHPSHIFTNDATYSVMLKIVNSAGCSDSGIILISAGQPPIIDFVADPDTVCASDTVFFTDSSTNVAGPGKNDQWFWSFGDGGSSLQQSPFHNYSDTGFMNVRLVVGYNGCFDTLIKDSFVYIYGPIVSINPILNCATPYTYIFMADIKSANQWWIDYDNDGNNDYTSPYFTNDTSLIEFYSYTFPSRGMKNITIGAINDSCINDVDPCVYSDSVIVLVADMKASFSIPDSLTCINKAETFAPSNLQDVNFYVWDFDDGSFDTIGPSSVHAFDSSGEYHVKLVVMDINGCSDTLIDTIFVYSIQGLAEVDTPEHCADHIFKFADKTISDTTLASWIWAFGDGNNSGQQNPDHTYNAVGSYLVTFVVTDVVGCSDDYYLNILTSAPHADFFTLDSSFCAGESAYFMDLSSGSFLSFQWNFGDGQFSSDQNPTHTFLNSGYHSVSLKVTDIDGCTDSITFQDIVYTQETPVAGFKADTMIAYCYPLLVTFTDTSISDTIANWAWSFGDNTTANIPDEVKHSYLKTGYYTVSLIVTTPLGCRDSITKNNYIQVFGPEANFSLSPDTVCKGDEVSFRMYNDSNVFHFKWDFGDGSVVDGTSKTTIHKYNKVGMIYPFLLYSDSLDECKKSRVETLYVHYLYADFDLSDSISELPLTVDFTDNSINAIDWHWYFGDGTDTITEDPDSVKYNKVGTYEVALIISDSNGCFDTMVKIITVLPLPSIIDMPNAFTPGKAYNNTVYVNGFRERYKELVEYKIYNRWGQVVFQTTNPEEGWDGTYLGKPQNVDTYVYMVKVKTFEDQIISKNGYINLLR